ncbi:TRAP transporter substrate-binding protein [Cupriavidus respiraculi]|uniref:TRAP transporter substrate-binding protein n=1 Tax=Cupriavidus respiraculi TaxID=195930 RepID=UPI001C956A42|nr:TRAP transporter substrate-binding protein [Cupriavidus respiraculi]MBY4945262.1 TRAP transporter substrate-binding protein [Cupriavidus respiraculi]
MQRKGMLKSALLGGLMASAFALAPLAHAQVKWDLPTGYPSNNPHTINLDQFAKDVGTATQGKLVITLHPNGSLFKANEIKRAVQSDQAQMGEVLMSLLENENALFGVDAVPFLATGFDASQKLWQAQRPVLERLLDRQGIKLLYAVAWPPQGIYAKKEIKSGADMKGLKWRAYNPATTKIAQAVGAQPMTIQAAELSQALSTGVVDSFMSSGATGVDSKVWESLTHFHTVDAWLPKNMLIVNKREFEKLDKATQDAVVKAAKDAETRGWQRMREYTQQSLDTLAKNKMTVVKPTAQLQADMKKVGDELLAEWEKKAGADGKEIIAAYRK